MSSIISRSYFSHTIKEPPSSFIFQFNTDRQTVYKEANS